MVRVGPDGTGRTRCVITATRTGNGQPLIRIAAPLARFHVKHRLRVHVKQWPLAHVKRRPLVRVRQWLRVHVKRRPLAHLK